MKLKDALAMLMKKKNFHLSEMQLSVNGKPNENEPIKYFL